MSDKIARCLWFDGQAEEAANFFAPLLPDSQIDAVHRALVRITFGSSRSRLRVTWRHSRRAPATRPTSVAITTAR